MRDDLDIGRLAEVPDPFTEAASAPPLAVHGIGITESPTRSRVRAFRVKAAAGALLFQSAWLLFVEHRPDLGTVPLPTVALGLAIPLVAAVVALRGVLGRGAHGLGPSATQLAGFAGIAVAVFVVGTALAGSAEVDFAAFWNRAARCSMVTAVLTAVPFGLGAWAFRRAFVAVTKWRTAALGVACGVLEWQRPTHRRGSWDDDARRRLRGLAAW
jgi:hypothetical protein